MTTLAPYNGPVRKLVLGIDIGTTFSGISYAILKPGRVPKIQSVNCYPGQEGSSALHKIPSILYYRPDGSVHSVGAEAAVPGIELDAEDENLFFVQWFKLHLRPEHLDSQELNRSDFPPLPPGKTVVEVFADFLHYLFDCARKFIITTIEADGEENLIWDTVKDNIDFILGHPNGWEGLQQEKMRKAAASGGLISDDAEGHARVHFVSEGEASLQFCIGHELITESGKTVMIVDAGGGTVDISSYSCVSTSPLSVEEIAPAECILQGSTRVNVRAEKFLRERLSTSKYGNDGDIKTMVEVFDKAVKPIFKESNENSFIKFGSLACNDLQVKIRRGQLALTGEEMESFFAPSLEGIVKAIERQKKASLRPIKTVFLVGGFAASPWLFAKLQERLKLLDLLLYKPNTQTNKAVAEGAVSFHLDHNVTARVMRMTYGVICNIDYVESNPEHVARKLMKIGRPSGRVVLPNAFSSILNKGALVREKQEMSRTYFREAREEMTLNNISTSITCYRGPLTDPHWMDVDRHHFTPLCTVHADTSQVARTPRKGPDGLFFVQIYKVVLLWGLTELKAQISWEEGGVEKRGPATIVYDDEPEEMMAEADRD